MQNISRERVPELDGIRAIACLLVLWVHIGPQSFQPPSVLAAGSTGVDLFFVLSGFLITRILFYNRANKIPLSNFMVKRAARIFPVAYLGLALGLFIRPSPEIIYSAIYLQNFAAIFDWGRHVVCTHYWTLAIEEQFYLVVPFIVMLMPTVWAKRMLGAICIACVVSVYVVSYFAANMDRLTLDLAISGGTTTRGWLLLAGSLISCVERQIREDLYFPSITIAMLFVISTIFVSPSFYLLGLQDPTPWFAGPSGFGDGMIRRQLIVLALFIFCLSIPGRRSLTILRDPLLGYIGSRSYGLYVYHILVFEIFGVRRGLITSESTLMVCLALLFTLVVAELSYRLVEMPIMRIFATAKSGTEAAREIAEKPGNLCPELCSMHAAKIRVDPMGSSPRSLCKGDNAQFRTFRV